MGDLCYRRPMLDRIFRHAGLMDSVMECLGVDLVAAVRADKGMAWYEARSRCIECCSERECLDWLAGSGAQARSEPPPFCPNAHFFRRCRKRMPQATAAAALAP